MQAMEEWVLKLFFNDNSNGIRCIRTVLAYFVDEHIANTNRSVYYLTIFMVISILIYLVIPLLAYLLKKLKNI
ncbi:cyanate permease [Bacillus niacini]|uniref:Cyanate permease n=1 Tax=Neobacillus niacini TaxID=86668 RepID=A0A852TKH8_9BACI|nr:cyanate permease [Neobacillus niacini]